MRRSPHAPVFVVAFLAVVAALSIRADEARPTPTPASAVDPSDLSAVAPAFPERAAQTNREVPFAPTVTPASPPPTPAAAPTPTAAAAEAEAPTVSAPVFSAPPASGSAHARPGVVSNPVAITHGAASTVTDYEKGKSLTVRTPAGSLVRYGVARDAVLPDDLAPGRQVLVESKVVRKRRVATKVAYADGRVVISNVN